MRGVGISTHIYRLLLAATVVSKLVIVGCPPVIGTSPELSS